jgi:hypothetical protein
MSPDILSQITIWIKEQGLLTDEEIDKFIFEIKRYTVDQWIHPGVFLRRVELDRKTVYQVFNLLDDKGILQMNYELYCHVCNQFEGQIFESFSEIPNEMDCERCEHTLTRLDNAIVVYKVKQSE